MNPQAVHALTDGPARLLAENSTSARERVVGVLIQLLMIYLVSRDLLVPGFIVTHYLPYSNVIIVRTALALLLGWMAISGRGLGSNFSAFGSWGWIIIAPFGMALVVEGMLTIVGDSAGIRIGAPRTIVVIFVNSAIVLFAVGMAYLFAARTLKPRAVLRFLLQPYCYFAIFVSATGLAAWLLLTLGIVQAQDWILVGFVSKYDLTASTSGSFYTMPYYLGLIAHESQGSFLGFKFARATGLFEVPSVAAFYVTPVLFLLPLVIDARSKKWMLMLIYAVILSFLFAVQSATNLVVLGAIGSLFLGRLTLTGPRGHRLMASLALLLLVAGLWASGSGGTIGGKWSRQGKGYLATVTRTIDEGTLFGAGYLQPHNAPVGILSTVGMFSHVGMVALLGFAMMLSRRPHWYVGGSLIYVAMHAMKKLGTHLTMGFYVYILVIFALMLASYWGELRSPRPALTGLRPPAPPRALNR